MVTKNSFDKNYTNYLLNRTTFRKIIRSFYLNNILKWVHGKTIDFGCGIGDLLKRLPNGSIGLEINPSTVEYCKEQQLNVHLYDPESDCYNFKNIESGSYKTFVSSHVLEHLTNSSEIFAKIQKSCYNLGIENIIIIVPGHKGFNTDKTHITYIDKDYIIKNMNRDENYKIVSMKYFPLNLSWFGSLFTHNELVVVYAKK